TVVGIVFHEQHVHVIEDDLHVRLRARCRRAADRSDRQRQDERRALSFAETLDAHVPPVQLDELPYDREPQAETTRALARPGFRLTKALKHQRKEIRANPDTVVRDGDLDVGIAAAQTDRDTPTLRRELDGIREQIPYALLKSRRISGRRYYGFIERAVDRDR